MTLDRSLQDTIPAKAQGKVIDKDWSKVFAFEQFPECQHKDKKQEIDCVDCVEKLYAREKWLENYLANVDKEVVKDLDGTVIGPVAKVKVVRGRYDDCIGIVTEP